MSKPAIYKVYNVFFDPKNIDYIHKTLIDTVYKVTNGKYRI